MKYLKPLKLYEESMKNNTNPSLIGFPALLGLVVGEKYASFSVINKTYDVARLSLPTVSTSTKTRKSISLITNRLHTEISNLSLRGIVVGCSIDKYLGKLNVEREKILIDELHKTGKFKGFNYTYWDKRLKSKFAERGVLENVNASVNTFPQDMPEEGIEEELQKKREELMDVYMASFVLQGFVDYGRLSSDKDRKGKMARSEPVIRLLSV